MTDESRYYNAENDTYTFRGDVLVPLTADHNCYEGAWYLLFESSDETWSVGARFRCGLEMRYSQRWGDSPGEAFRVFDAVLKENKCRGEIIGTGRNHD